MSTCEACGADRVKGEVLPAYVTDLGGVSVRLVESVRREQCEACHEETFEIPDLEGLMHAAALARALIPIRLSGAEVRFIRLALDMTGREFAEAMELTPETISRWENGGGIGGYSEKLLRHNVCALLHKNVKGMDFDPETIVRMRIIDGTLDSPIPFRLAVVRDCDLSFDNTWCKAAA